MKTIKNFWYTITMPFTALAVAIDESKRINEDGSWDKYHARKNRRAQKNQSI